MHASTARRAVLSGLAAVIVALAPLLLAPGPASGEPDASDPVGVWPLHPTPEVVRGFEPPSSTWGAGHRGVDLLGRPGQPVRAALPGVVSFAGVIAGRGVVVVDHGSTRTTYEPVDPAVGVGSVVPTGGRIGTLEAGLSHCFPRTCLHWGLLRGEEYLDPLSLLGVGPVRLLPLDLLPVDLVPAFMLSGAPAGRPFAAVPP